MFIWYRVEYPRYPNDIGIENGLSVIVNTSTIDYTYPLFNFAGSYLLLFAPSEYPDPTSGNTRTEILDPGSENMIRVSVITYEADYEVKNYDLEKVSCNVQINSG